MQALRHADGMGGAPLAPTLLALLPLLLRLQVLFFVKFLSSKCVCFQSYGVIGHAAARSASCARSNLPHTQTQHKSSVSCVP